MSEAALDRVARALNLIPFISSNPGLSIIEIAERFNSTPSQISKDLTLLHMCGLPGYGHLELLDIQYEDLEHITVTDAQVLDQPRSLTQLEAMTLSLGLQLLGELASDENEQVAISNLQKRIAQLLGDQISSAVTIGDGVKESPLLPEIMKAIESEHLLVIEYNSASSDSMTSREIFPLSLTYHDGNAYLQAVAVREGELRTLRVDRIVRVVAGEKKEGFGANFSHPLIEISPQVIEIEMGRDGLFFIEKHNEIVTSYSDLGEKYRISLRVTPGEWILRTLLAWPSPVMILAPVDLSATLLERIKSTLSNYQ